MRAKASNTTLSHRDTCLVKGMLERGDRQHDIAAYFGVNGGRIAEVVTGDNQFPNATPASEEQLPPTGPYITRVALKGTIESIHEAIEAIDLAEAEESVENIKAAIILARETLVKKIEELEKTHK